MWRDKRPGLHPPPFPPPEHLPHTKYTKPFSSIKFLATLASPHGKRVFPFAAENAPGIPCLSEYPHLTIDDFEAILFYGKEGKEGHADSINYYVKEHTVGDILHFFCDSSLTDDGADAATVLFHGGMTDRYKFSCGKKATAYDAEMLALAAAARQAREMAKEVAATHLPDKGLIRISFFTDCTSTITNILDPGPHPNQLSSLSFISNIRHIILLFPSIRIRLGWSPGHQGVWGNNQADYEAKLGTKLPGFHHPTQAFLKGKIKVRVAKRMWKLVKSRSLGTRFINHYGVSPIPTTEFINTDCELFRRVTQTLSGHGYTGEYYSRMKLDASPWCLCSATPGAPVLHMHYHVLQECSRHASSHHYLLAHNPDLHNASWDLALLGELKTRLSWTW